MKKKDIDKKVNDGGFMCFRIWKIVRHLCFYVFWIRDVLVFILLLSERGALKQLALAKREVKKKPSEVLAFLEAIGGKISTKASSEAINLEGLFLTFRFVRGDCENISPSKPIGGPISPS